MARAKKVGAVHIELGANDSTVEYQNKELNTNTDGYVDYGEDDSQFDYLIYLYNNSPTLSSVLNALIRMVYGEGLNDDSVINPKDVRKIVTDFVIFNNWTGQKAGDKYSHISTNFVRAHEVDDKNIIPYFGYSTDWDNASIEVKQLDNWEVKPTAKRSIYYGKPFYPNAFYYALPPYEAGLRYCEQEVEIAKYQLNHTKNGFSANKLINHNNGVPDEDTRKQIVGNIKKKLTGGIGDPFIVAFNDDKDRATTVENIDIDNAVDKYTYASEEAESQIMKVNGISSPVILGLPTAGGFSSNADEMREAKIRFINDKVKPMQSFIAMGLNEWTGRTDLEFINETAEEGEEIIEEEETELSEVNVDLEEFISLGDDDLKGFDLLSSTEVDYELDDELTEIVKSHFKPTKFRQAVNFVTTGKASPKTKSSQDTEGFAVRYRYTRGGKSNKVDDNGKKYKDRAFCVAMDNANKLYRKEDIVAMRNKPVNPGFGIKGARTYPIWTEKGGARCRHKWFREVYVKSETSDKSRVALGQKISVAEAKRQGAKVETNEAKVAIVPDNMKHKGFVTKSTMPKDAKAQTGGI